MYVDIVPCSFSFVSPLSSKRPPKSLHRGRFQMVSQPRFCFCARFSHFRDKALSATNCTSTFVAPGAVFVHLGS